MNTFTIHGVVEAFDTRSVGAQGTRLVELLLRLPPRGSRAARPTVVPVTIWDAPLRALAADLAPGTPLVVTGRVSARAWATREGSTRHFLELIAEAIGVASLAAATEPVAAPVADDDAPF